MDRQVCHIVASAATRSCCQELTSHCVCHRGAPRRWYETDGSSLATTNSSRLFGVRRAVTRFGVVTAEVHSASCPAGSSAGANCAEALEVSLSVEVADPPDQPVDVPTPPNESLHITWYQSSCSRSTIKSIRRSRFTLEYAHHTTTRQLYGQRSTASMLVWRE